MTTVKRFEDLECWVKKTVLLVGFVQLVELAQGKK
jgi:hypothetical protein